MSPQDLMRARLTQEKEERLRLEGVRSELNAKKAALVAENKKRKQDLDNLEKQLTSFIAVWKTMNRLTCSLQRTFPVSSKSTDTVAA